MGTLNGRAILRYGHMYDTRGGMEEYISDLNRVLHARNVFTTQQIELTSNADRVGPWQDGPVSKFSLFVESTSHQEAIASTTPSLGSQARDFASCAVEKSDLLYQFIRNFYSLTKIRRRPGEPERVGQQVREIHRLTPVDLICLHSVGGADASEVLAAAAELGVPTVYIHHFSNDRLNSLSVRRQLESVRGVAGVSAARVPRYLASRFSTVGDGIDTDFYSLHPGERSAREMLAPVIFLPARLTPAKGQMRVLQAAGKLLQRGREFRVVFAGRVESPEFAEELTRAVKAQGLTGRVTFAGPLDRNKLREAYALASVVAFPTEHHEGLPRILLESQAMEVPPVVFDSGGSAEGVQDRATGFVVSAGDMSAFTERLDELLGEAKRRIDFGHRGRQLAEEKFSLAALAGNHERFYAGAIGAKEKRKHTREAARI